MTDLMLRIRELYEALSPSEQRAAKYILENGSAVIGLPIADFADKSETSKAAVIRFAKRTGCSGYRDLILQLASELSLSGTKRQSAYTDIRMGGSAENIVNSVCLNSIRTIENSLPLISPQDVERAAELIIRAPRIDFYGSGASWIAAQDAQYKFMRIGKVCTAYADPHLQLTSADILSDQDTAVAFSWSGETRDIIEAARQAKKSGASLIAVTGSGKSCLAGLGDTVFCLSAPETFIRSGAMTSRIAQMVMVDILFSAVVSADYENISRYLEKTSTVAPMKWVDEEE